MNKQENNKDEFRDALTTLDKTGNRIWVYPKKQKGKYTTYRTIVATILLVLFVTLPFIKVGGEPLFLLDVLGRHFIIFGVVFTTHDLWMFAIAMITMMLFIVLFTVVWGRIFCGWICPQTIFMEMVYRKIEYFIEGDATQQRKLDEASWDGTKIFKKTIKHLIFFAIAVFIAHVFLSYIIGVDRVWNMVKAPFAENIGSFAAMMIFSGIFYLVFAKMREQVCTVICPYGRLQGVLLDDDSVIVSYDFLRGEPRTMPKDAKKLAAAGEQVGDCIDCDLCVKVCPTGIDIRNGTQLECINCTLCMDACDSIMEKVKKPTGLIRYDSYNGIKSRKTKLLTTRSKAYSVVLTILILAQVFFFMNRSDFETVILKDPYITFQYDKESDLYTNFYNFRLINKTKNDFTDVRFELVNKKGEIIIVGDKIAPIPREGEITGQFILKLAPDQLDGQKTKLVFNIYKGDEMIEEVPVTFLGPIN